MKCKCPPSVSRVPVEGGLPTLEPFLPKYILQTDSVATLINNQHNRFLLETEIAPICNKTLFISKDFSLRVAGTVAELAERTHLSMRRLWRGGSLSQYLS